MKWSGEVGLIFSLGINLYESLVRFFDLSQVRRRVIVCSIQWPYGVYSPSAPALGGILLAMYAACDWCSSPPLDSRHNPPALASIGPVLLSHGLLAGLLYAGFCTATIHYNLDPSPFS